MGNKATQIKKGSAYYITYPGYEAKEDSSGVSVPTGHAGVLMVDNNGTTKYFEYGRYNNNDARKYGIASNRGIVRKLTIPNFNGSNSDQIWNNIKSFETQNIGGKVTVSEIPDFDFNKGMEYIDNYNNDPDRKPYNLLLRNCGSFAENVLKAGYTGESKLPTVILRSPVNYSEEYEKAGFQTNTFKNGGVLKRVVKAQIGTKFEDWYKTVPKEKNDTTTYNLRRAFELAPKDQLDAFVKDPDVHLYSAYLNKDTGEYEFMKRKDHPTIQLELNWYNSNNPKAIKFRKKYKLDTSGDYYKYIPIGKSGIHIKPENRGKLTRLKRRTGKTEAELWKEGNPVVRKMITFARNARKWKHK